MPQVGRATPPKSRKAAAALRALSVVLVLLLGGSWLGQIAHFALIPHAFCAEHGELLELRRSPDAQLGDAPGVAPSREARANAADVEEGHEHCQVLARGQREQLLPTALAVAIAPAAASTEGALLQVDGGAAPQLACLALAPKTSPPGLHG